MYIKLEIRNLSQYPEYAAESVTKSDRKKINNCPTVKNLLIHQNLTKNLKLPFYLRRQILGLRKIKVCYLVPKR